VYGYGPGALPNNDDTIKYSDSEGKWLYGPGGGGEVPAHYLGGDAHDADSLANLNSKLTDATLDSNTDPRPPQIHGFRDPYAHSDIDVNPIDVQDEGSSVEAALVYLNFIGDGVTASSLGGGGVEVSIPGGGGSTESQILHLIWATH